MNDRLNKLFGGHQVRNRWQTSTKQTNASSAETRSQPMRSPLSQQPVESLSDPSFGDEHIGDTSAQPTPSAFDPLELAKLCDALEHELAETDLGAAEQGVWTAFNELKVALGSDDGVPADYTLVAQRLRLLDEVLAGHFGARLPKL